MKFIKMTYPLILAIILFITAICFENPFISCDFSERIIKVLNTIGRLFCEGLCFSFLFYYFIEFLPSLERKNKVRIIIKNKIKYLNLTIPFKPPDNTNITLNDFLKLNPALSMFEQLNFPKIPVFIEYMDDWFHKWQDKIEYAINEIYVFSSNSQVEYFENIEEMKEIIADLNVIISKIQICRYTNCSIYFNIEEKILNINKRIQLLASKF